jgi:hypothetical protein
MTKQEREHCIEWLKLFTGWKETCFTKMTDKELNKEYLKRWEKSGQN